jgi:hypothetical protein
MHVLDQIISQKDKAVGFRPINHLFVGLVCGEPSFMIASRGWMGKVFALARVVVALRSIPTEFWHLQQDGMSNKGNGVPEENRAERM